MEAASVWDTLCYGEDWDGAAQLGFTNGYIMVLKRRDRKIYWKRVE